MALIDALVRAKPASAKGKYVRSITLAATMSPAIKIDDAKYVNA
jgi:large subunit ribosomal protein L1